MKTPLIALAFVVAATAATAQLAAPVAADPAVPPAERPETHHASHAVLHADRERVRVDKARLRRARAARDDGAIRDAEARLRNDMDAWHADRERLKH